MVLLIGLIYPSCYEATQMFRNGAEGVKDYLTDLGNYADFLYIFGSIAMSFLHYQGSPDTLASKVVMIFVILLSVIRTMKFMRIF